MAYGRTGATSLLIDAPEMGDRGKGLPRIDQADIAESYLKRCVVDVRRGIDLLLARGVSPNHLAYVGHSLGAAVGGPLAGVENRLTAFVLMAGVGALSQGGWNRRPNATYRNQLAPYDGTRLIGSCASSILFQFGSRDDFVDRDTAERFIEAAPASSEVRWYDADHRLSLEALKDRASWLAEQLDFERIPDEWIDAARLPRPQTTKYLFTKPV